MSVIGTASYEKAYPVSERVACVGARGSGKQGQWGPMAPERINRRRHRHVSLEMILGFAANRRPRTYRDITECVPACPPFKTKHYI